MEKYPMLMVEKNQHHENGHTAQSNYRFNTIPRHFSKEDIDKANKHEKMLFLLIQAWEDASVQEFIHFFQVYWFMCIELFVVISDGSLYFCGIGGDTPLSFFIASV